MSDQARIDVWRRANITEYDLHRLKVYAHHLRAVLIEIQEAAAIEIATGCCTSKSAVWGIEKCAREAIKEVNCG